MVHLDLTFLKSLEKECAVLNKIEQVVMNSECVRQLTLALG